MAILLAVATAMPALARDTITVFAAASLRGALEEAVDMSVDAVEISFGGSGTIARQVALGAPADVVILAHPGWMDWLQGQNVLIAGTRRDLLSNEIVMIGSKDASDFGPDMRAILDRLDDGRLAMGQREAVPAGIYGKEWLENLGLWEQIEPSLAETENVRLALALVARGEAPLGVVYSSDAVAEPKVRVLLRAEAGSHSPIVYPAAAVTEEGAALLKDLLNADTARIFAKHGFVPLFP
ncbi:MAG: molybdate ABC transporter substrate-binding protein [Pseudomonadota bacterium]